MQLKIQNGFKGERLVIYPFNMVSSALSHTLTSDLVVEAMGYFPNAKYHYVSSQNGSNSFILLYCYKGRGFYNINGEHHEIGEQQYVVLPPDTPYQYGSSDSHPWHLYTISFCGTKSEDIYNIMKTPHQLTEAENARFVDRTSMLDEMLNIMEADTSLQSMAYVNMCFNHVIASFLFVNSYREAKYPKTKQENTTFLSKTLRYMNSHLDVKLNVSDMARELGYSDSYFYRLFYKHTKQAPMTYYMNLKLKRACSLLRDTCLQVNQVALKIGFDDSYYFSRFMKKQTGLSPKQYREQYRGKYA